MKARSPRAVAGVFSLGLVLALVLSSRASAAESNLAQNGFSAPVKIPQSAGLGEPTLAVDAGGRLFVTAPQGIGNVMTSGGSPLFRSTDGGATWQGPVRSQLCAGLSGGDTDLALDGSQDVWQTDLWLGSSCLSLSTDHGQSFLAGNPFGSELQPGDDRPWLAYDRISNQLLVVYDGVDALRVAATAPLTTPEAGLQVIQDVAAVPEVAVSVTGSPGVTNNVRECVCPPGGIAVDNSGGARAGDVYIAYSRQNGGGSGGGVGISRSAPAALGQGAGLTWTNLSVPNTGSTGSAFDTEWNFLPVKVDSNGTLYVAWGETTPSGVAIRFASSSDGGSTWHGPFLVSTITSTNTFPTMDVVGPGVVDFAYYGAPGATGDPNNVGNSQTWNVYYTQATAANTASPSIAAPVVAILDMHNGCIQTGGNGGCSDRSLLDFFTLAVDSSGAADIIYTSGDAAAGVNLFFTKN